MGWDSNGRSLSDDQVEDFIRSGAPGKILEQEIGIVFSGGHREDYSVWEIQGRKIIVAAVKGVIVEDTAMNTQTVRAIRKPNAAMRGGIDLDRAKMQMNVNKQGEGVQMRFDRAMIQKIKRDGFDGVEFRIDSILPVSLPLLLGLRKEEEELVGV